MAKKDVIDNKKTLARRISDNLSAYAYISPAIIVVMLVSFIPVVYGMFIAFTNMGLYHMDDYKIVWFDNFINVFTEMDAKFPAVLIRTFAWTIINVVAHVGIGVALALLLNRKSLNNVFKKVSRSVLILPWAVPNLISLMVWRAMYNEEFGFINQVLSYFGIGHIRWLTDPTGFWPFIAVCIANIWLGFPFMMMVASSGLQSIPEEIYEAAQIDGATGWQQIKKVTLPLLKPTMVPCVIMGTIWTFTNFNAVYLITEGGPMSKTDVLSTYTFTALKGLDYSRAATYGIITTLILIVMTLINLKVNKALDEEVAS